MDEFPGDIMKAAREALASFWEEQGVPHETAELRELGDEPLFDRRLLKTIARAIMAERQRAANIARKRRDKWAVFSANARKNEADEILTAIERGDHV